jgi:hypothetical protein
MDTIISLGEEGNYLSSTRTHADAKFQGGSESYESEIHTRVPQVSWLIVADIE